MNEDSQAKAFASEPTGQRILDLFAKKPRTRLTPVEIQKRAGFGRDELQRVVDALRGLSREGRIVRLKKNHYGLPDAQNLVTGRVHAHPDGFGFLILDDKGAEDLYLNRREMRRVMHGDRVMVRADRKKRGGVEAHVVQILERAQKRLIGTYQELDGRGYLIPMDPRIAAAIPLQPSGPKPEKGKVVAAEISRYGTAMSNQGGTRTSHRGSRRSWFNSVDRFSLRSYNHFPEPVHREIASAAFSISEDEIAARTDLREWPIVTIDGENARDFDDAVCVQKKEGHYELFVSIADVAFYVQAGTALDQEAHSRATSVYFPDRAIPMLLKRFPTDLQLESQRGSADQDRGHGNQRQRGSRPQPLFRLGD